MNMMELDGLAADVDSLFGIAGLRDDLMDAGIMGVAAGFSVIGGEALFSRVPMIKDYPEWAKAAIAVALGAGAGIATARYASPDQKTVRAAGAGIAAGLIGWGVTKGVRIAANKAGITALGQVSDRDLLLGMGAVDNDITVSDYRPVPGQTDGLDVADYRAIPGQTGGLGQAGDVSVSELQPMPGMNGRDGYMSGLAILS